jgi:MFS family permease
MNSLSLATAASRRAQYLTLLAALLGWMFDGAEMGVFSLVGGRALGDLLGPENPAREIWFGVVMAGFLVGAATGGVLFGWLGDRVGRVRAMTLSVLTYAIFTGLCGLSQTAWQMALLRFVAAVGMGGEWSLGVALVMEVWPNRSRAFMAGLIGASANVGYLLVAAASLVLLQLLGRIEHGLLAVGLSEASTSSLVASQGWRILMMLGAAPALLTFLIRLFVPESELWRHEQSRGATRAWETRDLLGVLFGALGPAAVIYLWSGPLSDAIEVGGMKLVQAVAATLAGLAVALVGYTYPVRRYLQRQLPTAVAGAGRSSTTSAAGILRRMILAAGLSGIALMGTWGLTQWIPKWADELNTDATVHAKEMAQIFSSLGAIAGTILAAFAGDWFGRRKAYCLMCASSFVSAWLLVLTNDGFNARFLGLTFLVGLTTASFYGWLPLYLPELFPTRVRATGQGFGYNFGRILAAVGVLQTAPLLALLHADTTYFGLAVPGGFARACLAISFIYIAGPLLIGFAPETRGQALPE